MKKHHRSHKRNLLIGYRCDYTVTPAATELGMSKAFHRISYLMDCKVLEHHRILSVVRSSYIFCVAVLLICDMASELL